MPTEPTILVRKPDGTTARMSLSQFRLHKAGLTKTMESPQSTSMSSIRPVPQAVTPESTSIVTTDKKIEDLDIDGPGELHEQTLPVAVPLAEAMTTPTFHPPVSAVESVSRPLSKPLIPIPAEPDVWRPALSSTAKTTMQGKSMMHDVEPGTAKPADRRRVGPIDEIAVLSLIDIRRLGNTPEERIAALVKKLYSIRDESYGDYLDALDAWRTSSAYTSYTKTLLGALQERQTIETYLRGKNEAGYTMDDFAVVLGVELAL